MEDRSVDRRTTNAQTILCPLPIQSKHIFEAVPASVVGHFIVSLLDTTYGHPVTCVHVLLLAYMASFEEILRRSDCRKGG